MATPRPWPPAPPDAHLNVVGLVLELEKAAERGVDLRALLRQLGGRLVADISPTTIETRARLLDCSTWWRGYLRGLVASEAPTKVTESLLSDSKEG